MTKPRPASPTGTVAAVSDQPKACQCMSYNAAISPTHPGHCCFVPATQTCHPEEFAEWERKYVRRPASSNGGSSALG